MHFANFYIYSLCLMLAIVSETCHANTIEKMTQSQKIA